jgi:hypothetical protein
MAAKPKKGALQIRMHASSGRMSMDLMLVLDDQPPALRKLGGQLREMAEFFERLAAQKAAGKERMAAKRAVAASTRAARKR